MNTLLPKTLKVKPVPGVLDGTLADDHKHYETMKICRHASKCRHVEGISGDEKGDTTEMELRFSRHFWHVNANFSERSDTPAQLVRVDGSNEFAAHKFSLMEGAKGLVRQEGKDPFHSHALVVTSAPASLSSEGHYFEVQVPTLFYTPGRPDRPRSIEPRTRTEGLILGLTKTKPSDIGPNVQVASAVPMSWCISTNGVFYRTELQDPTSHTRRSVNQYRVLHPPSWHRKPEREDQARCLHPPPSLPGTEKRNLRCSVPFGEGDILGLLLTPFGGLVLTLNGRREIMIPDAAVPADEPMYPLIEAFNHVRSVQLVPAPRPPG